MEIFVSLLISAAFGCICAMIATSRGRSGVAWFFIGFVTCIGLFILLALPDLKVQEEKERQLRRENRRLREQVKKDRAVADARHSATRQRLSAHDRALGVDTEEHELAPPEHPAASQLTSGLQGAQWYYLDADRERQGPIPLDELRALWRQATVGARTLVWTRSFGDWTALGEVPGLEEELRA